MTRLLTVGYETNDVNEGGGVSTIPSNGTITVVSTVPTPRTGTYCLKTAATTSNWDPTYKTFTLAASKTEIWLRFAFFAHNSFTDRTQIARINDASGTVQTTLAFETSGFLTLFAGTSGGSLLATSSATCSKDAWHVIEWRVLQTTTSSGTTEVWLDGTRVINYSGFNANAGTLSLQRVLLGQMSGNNNTTGAYQCFDDIAVNDTAGTTDNGRPGLADPPAAPTGLVAAAISALQIDLTWSAPGGTLTGYRVERCEGAGCSSFAEVGTPTTTTFSDTGLTPATSYSYRVRATNAAGSGSYSATATATTASAPEPEPAGVVVRRVSSSITFAGLELADVISARGQVAADSGWPTCSVFVTAKPTTGNEEDDLEVVAGAGTNVTRFVGKVRRFRPSAFPKGIEMVAMGTLAYAAEWAPSTDLLFDEEFPSGATDQALVAWALGFVPGISYVGADIQGTGITLGTEAPEAFDWRTGMSAWQYVQQLDQATLYRTYQQHDGTIRRVQMIGHPSSLETSFTLTDVDILEGSTASRNTEQTRNAALVRGHDYGDGLGPILGAAYGINDFQGDGETVATRHPDVFSSDLIEDGNDEDDTPLGYGGIDAQDIADAILNDVNKEFVEAAIRSWRDDDHGPGLTCLLDTLDRLAIGEKMWVQGYGWEVDNGWSVTYSLSGGGLEQPYEPPPV